MKCDWGHGATTGLLLGMSIVLWSVPGREAGAIIATVIGTLMLVQRIRSIL